MAIQDRNTLKNYFLKGATPTQQQFWDMLESIFVKGDTVPVANITFGILALTYASPTTAWDMSLGTNATITLTGDTQLSISNMLAGQFGLLVVRQDATGGRSLTLPAGHKVVNAGGGIIDLSPDANAIDVLSVTYDGTDYLWLCNKYFS